MVANEKFIFPVSLYRIPPYVKGKGSQFWPFTHDERFCRSFVHTKRPQIQSIGYLCQAFTNESPG